MQVIKANGDQEVFKPSKLRNSLRRAGARKSEIDRIVETVTQNLTDGAKTQTIYSSAFSLLQKSEEPIAAKYSLRRAIFGLGPTGFPFEDFLARLFEAEGYKTKKRAHIKGKCATHEIDVAGYKPDHSFVAEAKFHMRPGIKSDLQVAMYSYARYLDLKSRAICKDDECGIDDLYVITNTKFTSSAIKYAECSGIKLLSWNYPRGNTLQDRIERMGLYPITVLTGLSAKQKLRFLEANIILCKDILKKPHMVNSLGLSKSKRVNILKEAQTLCGLK